MNRKIGSLSLVIVFVWSAIIAPTVAMAQSVRVADEADRMARAAVRYASRGSGMVWDGKRFVVVCRDPAFQEQVQLMELPLKFLANRKGALDIRGGQPQYDIDGYVQVANSELACLIPYKTGTTDRRTGLEIHSLFFPSSRASAFLTAFANENAIVRSELRKVRAQVSANTRNIDTLWVKADELDRKGGGNGLGDKSPVLPDTANNVAIVAPAPKPVVKKPAPKPQAEAPPTTTKKPPKAAKPRVSVTNLPGIPRSGAILSPEPGAELAKASYDIKGEAGNAHAVQVQVTFQDAYGVKVLGKANVSSLTRNWFMMRTLGDGEPGPGKLIVKEFDDQGRPVGMTSTDVTIVKEAK